MIWTDSLVSPQIAALAPEGCERIRTSTLTLEDVLPLMIDRARQGLRVVRLHDGDPCLYGALSEQVCGLADAGIAVEVVSGLSAYQATASALSAELTIPGVVQTIVLSRAGGRTGVPEAEDLSNLARLKASLCLYLSARHVDEVQATLLDTTADTPVALATGWLARPVAECSAPESDGCGLQGTSADSDHAVWSAQPSPARASDPSFTLPPRPLPPTNR